MITDTERAVADSEKALTLLYSSSIGKAVMQNLRDHASMSKPSQKRFEEVEKRFDKITITFFALFIGTFLGSSLVNWGIYAKTFSGYQANLTTKIEANEGEIKELKEIITNLPYGIKIN